MYRSVPEPATKTRQRTRSWTEFLRLPSSEAISLTYLSNISSWDHFVKFFPTQSLYISHPTQPPISCHLRLQKISSSNAHFLVPFSLPGSVFFFFVKTVSKSRMHKSRLPGHPVPGRLNFVLWLRIFSQHNYFMFPLRFNIPFYTHGAVRVR